VRNRSRLKKMARVSLYYAAHEGNKKCTEFPLTTLRPEEIRRPHRADAARACVCSYISSISNNSPHTPPQPTHWRAGRPVIPDAVPYRGVYLEERERGSKYPSRGCRCDGATMRRSNECPRAKPIALSGVKRRQQRDWDQRMRMVGAKERMSRRLGGKWHCSRRARD